jgi:hypothetical protein
MATQEYKLTVTKNANGQPLRMFKALRDNNEAKLIDQLTGICSGILADGIVNEQEAIFFANWVRKHTPLEPAWPFTDILARVEKIFADGVCTEEERLELKLIMEAICGHATTLDLTETFSTTLPFDEPEPTEIVFPQRIFNVTGKFAFGSRREVMRAIESRGGIPSDAAPTKLSNYLVIGLFASRDWIHTNYGRKIEKAVDLRKEGSGLRILSEDCWRKFIN